MDDSVFVHIVTYNSESLVDGVVESIQALEGVSLHLHITDNASSDHTRDRIQAHLGGRVTATFNSANLGFSAAHNQGVKIFLEGEWGHLLVLNPDILLEPHSIGLLLEAVQSSSTYGLATPKLFRADAEMQSVKPPVLDAAGMELTVSIRHFDRGSQQTDSYFDQEEVFGGTGACLLLTRACVRDLLLKGLQHDSLKYLVCPELMHGEAEREPLFDEAFFAYREDADLCWRAALLGWRCVFTPSAVGYHRRVVLSTNRKTTSSRLNGLSVQNRFLLQLNNYFPTEHSLSMFLSGFLIRNILVIVGVFCMEWSSLPYLVNAYRLIPRALERRNLLWKKSHV